MLEFASELGIAQGSLSRYEAGKSFPGGQVILRLMQFANAEEKNLLEQCLKQNKPPESTNFLEKWEVKAVFHPGETFISGGRKNKQQQERLDQVRTLADDVIPRCDTETLDMLLSILRFIEKRPMLGTIAAGTPVESFEPGPPDEMDQRPARRRGAKS